MNTSIMSRKEILTPSRPAHRIAEQLHHEVRDIVTSLTEYFKDDPQNSNRTTPTDLDNHEDVSIIRIKFRKNKKKIIISIYDDKIIIENYSKTINIIENIDQLYSVMRRTVIKNPDRYVEEIRSAVVWGIFPRKSYIPEIYKARGLSIIRDNQYNPYFQSENQETGLREDCLYYGLIEEIVDVGKAFVHRDDGMIMCQVKFDELREPVELPIYEEDLVKLLPGNLYIYNHRGAYNFFSFKVAKHHLLFSSAEYQRLWLANDRRSRSAKS